MRDLVVAAVHLLIPKCTVFGSEESDRIRDVEGIRFELLDESATLARLFGEDDGAETELFNEARNAFVETTGVPPKDDEDVWATGRAAAFWWRLVEMPRS